MLKRQQRAAGAATTGMIRQLPERDVRLGMLGAADSGRRSLMARFVFGSFSPSLDTSFETAYRKPLGKRGHLELTRSENACAAAYHEQLIRSCDGFLMVYAIDSRESFRGLARWKRRVERVTVGSRVPLMLVGYVHVLRCAVMCLSLLLADVL